MELNNDAAQRLLQIIESIESLEMQKREIADAVRDVYATAKGQGFDAKVLREVVKMRALDSEKRKYHEEILEHYKAVLGL